MMTGTSLIATMAAKQNMDPAQFARTIRATVMPSEHTEEQFAAFMLTANRYGLNPITREIYAYPARKGGGITPVVSLDGWVHLVNSHPACNGFEFSERREDGKLVSITCTIWRKDRDHPVVVTEYLAECYRNTDPWNQMPSRMLRHKALKEAARYAFGFAGITDEDEARDADRQEKPPAAPLTRVADRLDQFTAELEERATEAPQAEETASQVEDADIDQDTGEVFDFWPEAIDRIMTMVTDPDVPSVDDRLANMAKVREAYQDALPEQRFRQLWAQAEKVARGEQKMAAARKYLEAL